jgi:hypothetical protein
MVTRKERGWGMEAWTPVWPLEAPSAQNFGFVGAYFGAKSSKQVEVPNFL